MAGMLDTVDVDSLTEAFAEDVQDTDDFQRIVSSDEEDFGDPDNGSIDGLLDLTPVCQTLWCNSRDVLDTGNVDSRPVVMFSDHLFTEEELADMFVTVHGEVPMRRCMDLGVAVLPPVADQPV